MDGSEGPRAQSTRAFARNFARLDPTPVAFWDERLSTAAVKRALIANDVSRARRAEVIDKMAAAYILQGALDRLALWRARSRAAIPVVDARRDNSTNCQLCEQLQVEQIENTRSACTWTIGNFRFSGRRAGKRWSCIQSVQQIEARSVVDRAFMRRRRPIGQRAWPRRRSRSRAISPT